MHNKSKKMQESQPTSPKLSLDEIRNKIIFEMQKGKESLQIIRSISLQYPRLKLEDGYQNDDQDIHKRLDHHSMLALNAYVYSLSMLKNCNFERPLKRKIEYLDENVSHQGSSMDVTNDTTSGKGRYKRSKSAEAREQEVTNLTDDGFAWRKYGQKAIHNSKHPRNYYRCTHKHDQKCQATKQVQQISENPTKYKIIYHGNHTCKCILKTNPIIIDDTEEHSSGIFFSFDQSNKQHNPAMLFPTANVTAVKQEHESPIKQEMPSISHDSNSYNVHSSLNSPPSSNNVSFSQDATEITGLSYTPVSEQSDMISTAENYQDNVGEEDYSYIWAELEVFEDLCAYNYN